jgi:hypothetical protein
MTLHANAAQAALKLSCFVQAIEHCDKVSIVLVCMTCKPIFGRTASTGTSNSSIQPGVSILSALLPLYRFYTLQTSCTTTPTIPCVSRHT